MDGFTEIIRIDSCVDSRFSRAALDQHGCYLVNGVPCEVLIRSGEEAVIFCADPGMYPLLAERFRYHAPQITRFLDPGGKIVCEYPAAVLLTVSLDQIRPTQFYVDEDKLCAVRTFIRRPEDIILQVFPQGEAYVCLDGHTRLFLAVRNGWSKVCAVAVPAEDWAFRFLAEAERRGIRSPGDMILTDHAGYEENWNRFCERFMAEDPPGEAPGVTDGKRKEDGIL